MIAREMPPWHASPDSMKMANDPSLSQEAIDTVAAWVDAGAPEGDPAAMPEVPTFAEGWRFGEPDVIIQLPAEFQIPPEGEKPWVSVFAPTPFTEDVWIQAMQIRTDNPAVSTTRRSS